MSNLSRFKALKTQQPATKKMVEINTWVEFLEHHGNCDFNRISLEQHARLEPYKQKYDDGTFAFESYGVGTDYSGILNILY